MQKPKYIFGDQADGFLQPEIVFILNTSKDRFVDWTAQKLLLQFHAKPREALNQMTSDGRFSSVLNQVYTLDLLDFQKEYPGFGYILFEILPLSDKDDKESRIEVSMSYTNKAFPQMQSVLQLIAATYKESFQIIQQYCDRFSRLRISQIADRLNLTPQAIEKIKELEIKLEELKKIEVGKMLTAHQMDTIVQYHLYVFPTMIREWEFERLEQGAIILYSISAWQVSKAAKVPIGTYQVGEAPDGTGRCGWIPTSDNDTECETLRAFFHTQVTAPPETNYQPIEQINIAKAQVAEKQESEPWKLSRPNKQERDRIIWEMRNKNHTWEEILEALDNKNITTGISTLKENYDRMKQLLEVPSTHL